MIKVKFVKKSGQWCVTQLKDKKQTQKWFESEADARAEAEKLEVDDE